MEGKLCEDKVDCVQLYCLTSLVFVKLLAGREIKFTRSVKLMKCPPSALPLQLTFRGNTISSNHYLWLWICEGGLHGVFKGGIFVSGHGWTFWPSSRWGNAVGGGYGGLACRPAWSHTPLSCGPEILILFARCICQSSHAEEQSCFLVVFPPSPPPVHSVMYTCTVRSFHQRVRVQFRLQTVTRKWQYGVLIHWLCKSNSRIWAILGWLAIPG